MVTVERTRLAFRGLAHLHRAGKPVSVDDLILGMIVQSGNDATIALANGVAGTEDTFAQLMIRPPRA